MFCTRVCFYFFWLNINTFVLKLRFSTRLKIVQIITSGFITHQLKIYGVILHCTNNNNKKKNPNNNGKTLCEVVKSIRLEKKCKKNFFLNLLKKFVFVHFNFSGSPYMYLSCAFLRCMCILKFVKKNGKR